MLVADGPSVGAATVAIGGAFLVTGVVAGVAIGWLRGTSATRSRWTRRSQHFDAAEDNATPVRILTFVALVVLGVGGGVYAAIRLRPGWLSGLVCYDLALLSVWWLVVALNGVRLRRASSTERR